jgi:hypothetical protein
MRSLRSRWWRWLTAAALGGGLVAGGAWYANSYYLIDALTGKAAAQEAAATAQPAATAPTAPQATAPQAGAGARRVIGEVVQISADPTSFTIRAPTGDETAVRVREGTVFMAGHDRPYSFSLLKPGDQVDVRILGQGKAANADPSAPSPPGAGRAKRATTGGQNAVGPSGQAADEPVARQVVVRPAGEPARGKPGRAVGQSMNVERGRSGGARGTVDQSMNVGSGGSHAA